MTINKTTTTATKEKQHPVVNDRHGNINSKHSCINSNNTECFDHVFEGWSVWLEPCHQENVSLVSEMGTLMEQCGGSLAGLSPFVPHCTLLYNVDKPSHLHSMKEQRQYGELKLKQCVDAYSCYARTTPSVATTTTCNNGDEKNDMNGNPTTIQRSANHATYHYNGNDNNSNNNSNINNSNNNDDDDDDDSSIVSPPLQLQLEPTQFYYFEYPKSADNNRGFGCVISMLLLEKTPKLAMLHETVRREFPPDERHGGSSSSDSSSSRLERNPDDNKHGTKFTPHVALVYAPEVKGPFLAKKTEEFSRERKDLLKPVRANALTLWSTQGKLCDWYRIASILL